MKDGPNPLSDPESQKREMAEELARRWPPSVEQALLKFVSDVETGKQPIPWLMEFMAEGAREFLRGGKAWQKGKGGRPPAAQDEHDIKAWLLHEVCGLSVDDVVVALGEATSDGKDRSRTIRRKIQRGRAVFVIWQIGREGAIRTAINELIQSGFTDFPSGKARRCIDHLSDEISRMDLDEREPY